MKIDRKNPLPLYIQLKDLIIEKVDSEEWKRGEVIPTELELQENLKLSRTTVRQALTELVFEGILERQQGKGTFVAEEKLNPMRPDLTGFTKDMKAQGHDVKSIIINEEMVINRNANRNLNIPSDEKVLKLERIRLVDGIPIGHHDTYLNVSATPNLRLNKFDFTNESLYSSLEQDGIIFGDSNETVEAALPNESYAKILKIDPLMPVLKLKRIARLEDGTPYEYSNMVYRADKYKYTTKLRK